MGVENRFNVHDVGASKQGQPGTKKPGKNQKRPDTAFRRRRLGNNRPKRKPRLEKSLRTS